MSDDSQPLLVPCSACGKPNRVPRGRLRDGPRCGECRAALLGQPPAALDGERFDRFLGHSDLPVVVDFWADWCGPCKAMAPAFAAASETLAGEALLAKLDTDAAPAVAERYRIQGIPCLILFDRGREVARTTGAMGTAQIAAWVRQQTAPRA